MPDPREEALDVITYYRENQDLIGRVLDDLVRDIAPEPDDDPAVTYAALIAAFTNDHGRAMLAAAAAIMRLAALWRAAENLPRIPQDNPVYVSGYEQGRTDFTADAATGHARRGDVVETWIKRIRDEYAIGGKPPVSPTLQRSAWDALDDLLDRYRLHADTGTPLTSTEPMGPTTAGGTDDA